MTLTQKDLDSKDLIALRRSNSGYGNPYNPESLITGAEIERGLTYYDKRVWPDATTFQRAVEGYLTPDEIVKVAPRVQTIESLHRRLLIAARQNEIDIYWR